MTIKIVSCPYHFLLSCNYDISIQQTYKLDKIVKLLKVSDLNSKNKFEFVGLPSRNFSLTLNTEI